MSSSISFIIGNTYAKRCESRAELDKTGRHRKIHDWRLYVDILAGDPDLISKVQFDLGSTFDPSKFTRHCPIKATSGNNRWRFNTRQQSYGPVTAKITIIGRGGTVLHRDFRVELSPGGKENGPEIFAERRPLKPFGPVAMADVEFGIELELSTSSYVSAADVTNSIQSNASVAVEDMTDDYSGARARNDIWVLMTDGSIQCSIARPDCNRFELVSPILRGGRGLQIVDQVVRALGEIPSIKVNQTMGFHVHVNVSRLSVPEQIKVCQNFIKYEKAMDSFMPPSRRDGNQYCQSNRLAVAYAPGSSNKEVHERIASCQSVQALGNLMSPDKFRKLNMHPLTSGRQPTIEFRQHSATYNKAKVKNWIRFCVAFVHNSARLKAPSYLSSTVDNDEMFELLMMHVVKDRFLRDFYRQRRIEVADQSSCCDGCASGSGCEVSTLKR